MRSKLFVPGSRPELFEKALRSATDALSFDLEDSVDPRRKDEARAEVVRLLRALPPDHGKTIIVRINAVDTPYFAADTDALAGCRIDLVNLPKPASADDVHACADALARTESSGTPAPRILANIETPRALRLAAEIATASPRVAGLQVGWADLLEPLNIDRSHHTAIEAMQLAVRLAAGEAGIWAYDGVFANLADLDGFRREAEAARRLGFIGKSVIHPSQIPVANEVFQPTPDEIAHAIKVVDAATDAAQRGVGAFKVDGKMIDAPFVRRAEAVLASARRLGLAPVRGS